MEIPIKNIYYLLCYAYNKLEEGRIINVDQDSTVKLSNLFARILSNGIAYLIKRGLDRGYNDFDEELVGIRGKINFNVSLKRHLFHQAKAYCEYDELSFNVLHNKILKSVVKLLLKVEDLDLAFRDKLLQLLKHLSEIEEIKLNKRVFRLIQLNSNNSFYDFLLKICELIVDNILVSTEEGDCRFRDFIRDEKQMSVLFEEFVRNFYKLEQNEFYVTREYIEWDAIPLDENTKKYLPRMQTVNRL